MSGVSKVVTSRAEEILVVAQDFIQTRGYNGFSYRDIAATIGIKSASIHYHFPTKGDLGRAVTARYSDRFAQALQGLVETTGSARDLLTGYAALFRKTLIECDRLCLCGMLAGEVETVPDIVKEEIKRFFEEQQLWLAQVIKDGIEHGEISPMKDAQSWAMTFVAALEGAMLVSRGLGDYGHFDRVSVNLLDVLFDEAIA